MLPRTAKLLLAALLAVPAAAQDAAPREPDLAALVDAGRASIERLERQPASWSARTRLPGGAEVVVDVLATPTMRRRVLSLVTQGRPVESLRIIERDDVWYAVERQKAGRYRPYEAPFDLPTAYLFLERAEPRFLNEVPEGGLGTFEGARDGAALYRRPIDDNSRAMLEAAADGLAQALARNPASPNAAQLDDRLRSARDVLEHGIPLRVDLKSGLITQFGTPDKQGEILDFTWRDSLDPAVFTADDRDWADHTDDLADGNRDDLVMIAHNGFWRPGQPSGDVDARLLNVRTGRYRRIPFQGGSVHTGCFLGDRSRVAVSGFDEAEGSVTLYEIDLRTGENRRLGGALLAGGISMMPALSPDGSTLAVLHKGGAEGLLDTQVCLVDLKTGEARPLGEAGDLAFLSWLPDGRSLLLLKRVPADPADIASQRTRMLARLDLDGRLTTIREGDDPVLLADGHTILFSDNETRAWMTCDLEGREAKAFAGGLPGYGFPTAAPDGQRLMFMEFRPREAPRPVVLRIGEAKGIPVPVPPGLWAMPAWR